MTAAIADPLLSAFGATTAALARAGERLALSPRPDLLRARVRLLEREALGHLEGEDINHEALALEYGNSPQAWQRWPYAFAQVFAKPLSAQPTPEAVHAWLETGPRPEAGAPAPAPRFALDPDRLEAWHRRTRALRGLPPLLAAADSAAIWARTAPLSRGNLVIGVMLGDRTCQPGSTLSAGGIAAIGLMQRQIPWLRLVAGATDDDLDAPGLAAQAARWRLGWLEAITAGALAVVALDQRLRLWLTGLDEAAAAKRRSSKLRALADFAATRPSFTVAAAAAHLRLSRQGATRLVEEARARHLVREITHGRAFRRYVAAL